MTNATPYDVAVVGLGCAGYTAAIYTARYQLSTYLVGREEGGLGMTAAEVGNWPGDIEIKGPDLMERFKQHAVSFENVTHAVGTIESITKEGDVFLLKHQSGDVVQARTVVFAMGSNKRHLGVPGEKELSGKGVTYCATCDAFFFKGKDVAVIGGGDAAVEGAAIVAKVAKHVYLIHRRNEFRAEPYWVDKVKEQENVTFVLERNVTEIVGDERVTGVKLDKPFDFASGEQSRTTQGDGRDEIALDGVFIEIGANPASKIANELGCSIDDKGFIEVDKKQETTVEGVFAAGDISNASNYFAQFTTAAGEAALAANSVFNYLQTGNAAKQQHSAT